MMELSNMKLAPLFVLLLTLIYSGLAVNCPDRCNCFKKSGLLDCSNAFKTIIPEINDVPEFITELVLTTNHIKQINFELRQYNNLTYLDISSNGLVNIEDYSFENLEKLHTLILRDNMLSELNNRTFYGLNNLISLDISENHLTVLSDNTFQYFPKLLELNLTENYIHRISDTAFIGLHALDSLHMMHNRLTTVPTEALQYIEHLRFLNLHSNNIQHILDYSFYNNSKLASINIANNNLKTIDAKSFNGLENSLKILDLQQNYLDLIPTEAMAELTQVNYLQLSSNNFKAIHTNTFYNLSNLEVLYLNNLNNLETIGKLAFNLKNLRELHLAFNPLLKHIHARAFVNVPQLKTLYLNNNGLHTFLESLLPWNNLETLDLSGNFIDCNCNAEWLLDVFDSVINNNNNNSNKKKRKNFITKSFRCRSPTKLLKLPVSVLKPSDFHCSKPGQDHATARNNRAMVVVTLSISSTVALLLIFFSVWRFKDRLLPISRQSDYKRQKNVLTIPEAEEEQSSIDTVT
ncbi:leucine-rich repeat neuronal protein 2-like [Argonauta hians]